MAKPKRLPFISSNHLSPSPFDLIHCVTWGPFHVPVYSGHRFFLIIMDDCTRFIWIFLLKHKSEVASVIQFFFTLVATQFYREVKCIRIDNAKELVFIDFLNLHGVLHQFSCVDKPQQNAVVERKHQHLLNVTRALYFQSQIPLLS